MSSESLIFKAQTVLSLWQQFCERHHELLLLTTREYSELLSNDLDKLEETVQEKNNVLIQIDQLDKERHEVINSINTLLNGQNKVTSISDLISVLRNSDDTKNMAEVLSKQNELLISLINDLRLQNRKSQHFLVKAINSIRGLKDEMTGNKSYTSYGPKGSASKLSVRP